MNTTMNTTMNTPHKISKKALAALVAHASPDDCQTALHGVFASDDGSVLVATDGHALLLRHDPQAGEGGLLDPLAARDGRLIHLAACKRAIKLCPRAKDGHIEIDADSGEVTVVDLGLSRVVSDSCADRIGPRDGFPAYEQVVPALEREGAAASIGVSPALVSRMMSALHGLMPAVSGVTMSLGSALDPIRVDAHGDVDGAHWIGVIMPMRL